MFDYFIPLHPKLTHYPVALFTTAIGFDIASFLFRKEALHKTALNIYVLAALVTPIVVRAGLWEEERLNLGHPVLDLHRTLGLWTMWVSLMSLPILWFVKKELSRHFRIVFLIFLIAVVSFVSLTGHNGGRMVYEYGVGMEE
jgi:uncharacterized membrane protein